MKKAKMTAKTRCPNCGKTLETPTQVHNCMVPTKEETRDKMTDNAGVTLNREEVEELAFCNICASMGVEELAREYLATQNDAKILQWATDEDGNFPAKEDQ